MPTQMLELQSYCEFRDVGGLQVSPAFDCLPDRLKGFLFKLLKIAKKTERPIAVSQLRPESPQHMLELMEMLRELRLRRCIYYKYDCKVEAKDNVVLCVSDEPRFDEDYKDLINRRVVYASVHVRRVNCSDEVRLLTREFEKELYCPELDLDGPELVFPYAPSFDVLNCWTLQGLLHPDRWIPYPDMTPALYRIVETRTHSDYPWDICTAIEVYAKSLASDPTKSFVPAYDLITFLTMKDTNGRHMYTWYSDQAPEDLGDWECPTDKADEQWY
jgi:hypothetical protein